MVLDWLMGTLAGVLDGWLKFLPGFDMSGLGLSAAISKLSGLLAVGWNLFPSLTVVLVVLGLGVAVEAFMIAYYWIMWLVKKIPFIGG